MPRSHDSFPIPVTGEGGLLFWLDNIHQQGVGLHGGWIFFGRGGTQEGPARVAFCPFSLGEPLATKIIGRAGSARSGVSPGGMSNTHYK